MRQIATNKIVKNITKNDTEYLFRLYVVLRLDAVVSIFFLPGYKCRRCQWCVKHFTMHLTFSNSLIFPSTVLPFDWQPKLMWIIFHSRETKRLNIYTNDLWWLCAASVSIEDAAISIKTTNTNPKEFTFKALVYVRLCHFWFYRFRSVSVNACQCQPHHSNLLRMNRYEWRNHLCSAFFWYFILLKFRFRALALCAMLLLKSDYLKFHVRNNLLNVFQDLWASVSICVLCDIQNGQQYSYHVIKPSIPKFEKKKQAAATWNVQHHKQTNMGEFLIIGSYCEQHKSLVNATKKS